MCAGMCTQLLPCARVVESADPLRTAMSTLDLDIIYKCVLPAQRPVLFRKIRTPSILRTTSISRSLPGLARMQRYNAGNLLTKWGHVNIWGRTAAWSQSHCRVAVNRPCVKFFFCLYIVRWSDLDQSGIQITTFEILNMIYHLDADEWMSTIWQCSSRFAQKSIAPLPHPHKFCKLDWSVCACPFTCPQYCPKRRKLIINNEPIFYFNQCHDMSVIDFVVVGRPWGAVTLSRWSWWWYSIWIWSTRGSLNLNCTNHPDHGHRGNPPQSGKNPHGRAGNGTRDLMVSSQKRWPLDHEAGHKEFIDRDNFQ
jgi:hypothetical protein